MDGYYYQPPLTPPARDIRFYRAVAYSLSTLGGYKVNYAYGADMLSMSTEQLAYCVSFYKNMYFRPILGEELMLFDSYCELIKSKAYAVAPDELLLNDGYIADTYADLMARRRALHPDYNGHATVEELFGLATEAIKSRNTTEFPHSPMALFSAFSDTDATLSCLAARCRPAVTGNRVCIGEKLSTENDSAFSRLAVIYASDAAFDGSLAEFLSSDAVLHAGASIEFCKTTDLLHRLARRHRSLSVNVSTLPMPQSGTFAAHELINNESVTVRFASAFLTEEVFGERVLVIHGNQIAAKLLCTAAKKCGLSYFDGIRADINPKKVSKVTSSSTVLKLNGTLFGILEELSGNIQIKLPDHKTEGVSAAELIPPSVNLARSDTDCVFSARLSPTDSPLPYHSGVYGVLSPLISAASRGVNRKNGEISLSVSASLSFNDEKSIGRSLAFILGLYRAQIELSIPLVGSCIEFTDGTSSEVTISVHGFSESPASLTLPSESVEGFLCGTADGDLLPNFGIIRELIDG